MLRVRISESSAGSSALSDTDVTARGMSNHAGTTMMDSRKDALTGMAKLIVGAEKRARELNDTLVFTVGKLSVLPGQENVIPARRRPPLKCAIWIRP